MQIHLVSLYMMSTVYSKSSLSCIHPARDTYTEMTLAADGIRNVSGVKQREGL